MMKLVKNWKQSPKWASIWAAGTTFVLSIAGAVLTDQQLLWVTAILAAATAAARVIDQGYADD